MSCESELNTHREMISEGIADSVSSIRMRTVQHVTLSKQQNVKENVVAGEEIIVDTNEYSLDNANCQTAQTAMYFEEALNNCNNIPVVYEKPDISATLIENSSIEKWGNGDVNMHSSEVHFQNLQEDESEEQEGDEETIATFVTAAGQQLALYAVEDSDEIFAVAVYDESGEPPTNFQFLMKSDVERLIGEGAVRTVKKPTQMKKRLLTTQPPVFLPKESFGDIDEQMYEDDVATHDISNSDNSDEYMMQEEESDEDEDNFETTFEHGNSMKLNSLANDIVYTTVNKRSDVTYLMMDDNSINVGEQTDDDGNTSESEEELMEQSTVQYIFLEDDQSESELTFDEILTTLQNMKNNSRKASKATSVGNSRSNKTEDGYSYRKHKILCDSPTSNMELANIEDCINSQCDNTDRISITPDRQMDDRQRLIDLLTDSPSTENATLNSSPTDNSPTLSKAKRSRKQQLTSVNRDDGEIIIQPASLLNEEETGRRRGKRRRRPGFNQTHAVAVNTRPIKRQKRQQVVEVIDLDIDEEEQQANCSVVEITLDDSKDKYSSDKENEIIMVKDSDSENEEGNSSNATKLGSILQCTHCSRNFRQPRAFETHLRVCQKSPANAIRYTEKKIKSKEEQIRKQYACKICQEKFDVVVALARHVRAEHSQRKKNKLGSHQKAQHKSLRSIPQKSIEDEHVEEDEQPEEDEQVDNEQVEDEQTSFDDDETTKEELPILDRVKKKQKQKNCPWEAKKLGCTDCGRWFSSSTLLDAHSLHHGTKKSEQRIRKCQICKKLIKSKMLFLRHLKMHSDAQCSSTTKSTDLFQRKLRTRQGARRLTSLRKRGRPRKF